MADETTTDAPEPKRAAGDGIKTDDPAPKETRLDDNNTEPATTVPGDAPFDTTDPTERASTVLPNPSDEALRVGTVNGVRKLPSASAEAAKDAGEQRVERYEARKPNGDLVTVEHNLDTGETRTV